MAKLTSGGVRINAKKTFGSVLALAMGTDYRYDEREELVEDLINFAKADKVGINAYIPSIKATKANAVFGEYTNKKGETKEVQFGWKPDFIEELSEKWEPTLLVKTADGGWPSPYLAFFDPNAKRKGNNRNPSKYARK